MSLFLSALMRPGSETPMLRSLLIAPDMVFRNYAAGRNQRKEKNQGWLSIRALFVVIERHGAEANALSCLVLRVLLAEVLGRVDHVGQRLLGLLPLPRLQAAVGVDPKLLRLEVLQHLL